MSKGGGVARISAVGVVVPAHNEEDRIGAALNALEVARRALPSGVGCAIVVVADACTDSTATLAKLRLRTPPDAVLETTARCVGTARRMGVDVARALLRVPNDRLWLASTDADTAVESDWLTHQVELARRGHVAVAGMVHLGDDATDTVRARFEQTYIASPDGTHTHVHGANLGVRADVYDGVGGWYDVATGEEHDLWRRLRAAGFNPTATAKLAVTTSGRTCGRAPSGFAADLQLLAGDAA